MFHVKASQQWLLQFTQEGRSCHAGHLLGDLASPFKRRSAAVDPAAPALTGPAVISVPSATWSALLGAVATALKAPQRLQSQLGRQILGPVRLELPPEQPQAEVSDDHSSEVMDIDIINGDPPAAAMPAEQGSRASSRCSCRRPAC